MLKAPPSTHDRASDLTQRRLFLHAETPKALLVSPSSIHATAETDGGWLPRSQVREIGRVVVPNPRAGEHGAAAILGVLITFEAPGWLLKARGIECDAEVAA